MKFKTYNRPKVLVAGFRNEGNQVVRNVKKYDCDVEWTGHDGGGWAKDADILLIVQCHISKEKAKALKEHYYGGAEIIYPWKGFSEVANDFHAALLKVKNTQYAQPKVVGYDRAIPGSEKTVVAKLAVVPDPLPVGQPRRPYAVDKVVPIVHQCLKNGFSHDDIAEYLNADGWIPHARMGGYDWTAQMVKNLIDNHALHLETEKKQEKETEQLNLIDEILKSQASDAQKIEWIARANRGEIKSLEWVDKKIVSGQMTLTQNRIGNTPVSIQLTKTQAKMILLHIADLNDFVKG